jgi:hypothetical protein
MRRFRQAFHGPAYRTPCVGKHFCARCCVTGAQIGLPDRFLGAGIKAAADRGRIYPSGRAVADGFDKTPMRGPFSHECDSRRERDTPALPPSSGSHCNGAVRSTTEFRSHLCVHEVRPSFRPPWELVSHVQQVQVRRMPLPDPDDLRAEKRAIRKARTHYIVVRRQVAAERERLRRWFLASITKPRLPKIPPQRPVDRRSRSYSVLM